jgi:transcriptional regulator with XRE-family HTH domain
MSTKYPNIGIQIFLSLTSFRRKEGKQMKSATELLGGRIRELRKKRGMIQEQLAEFIGIEQKHISLIERGKSYPSLDRLTRIAKILEVPLPALFDFEHLNDKSELALQIDEMVKQLSVQDQRRAYKIVKALLD